MPLVHIDLTRHMALRALGTITHHGGVSIRTEIAKYSSTLVRLIEEFPDDKNVIELAITTLAHCINAVLEGDSPANPKVLASLDMRTIVKVVTENTRKEWASSYLIDHALLLLSMSTLHATDACKSYPPMIKFLVAGLRSKDWVTRCICLGGVIRLHRKESEPDMRMLDPVAFTAAIRRGFPSHLSDLMLAYGPTRCDTYLTLSTSRDFQQAMMSSAQDHDLYALGLKMAEFILRTEFSIADGYLGSVDPITGQTETMDIGLPFTRYIDSLPHCARAIRARRVEREADLADILEIKFSIMRQRIPDAVDLAKKALKRNPDGAYFYYAITLSANHVEGLRAAKKGLKCKNITPFVRFQLLQRAVEHAGDMGIQILQDSPTVGKTKWEEGIVFLMSALEDAKTFVDQAPPDNRHMNAVLYWFILLTITIKHSELSTDLRELQVRFSYSCLSQLTDCQQGALRTSKVADDFSKAIGVTPPKTNLRLGQQTVVQLYSTAVKEFGNVIAKSESPDACVPVSQQKLEDDLAAWLEDMQVDDGDDDSKLSGLHPVININQVALYRCSWCGNPSAVLRKCLDTSLTILSVLCLLPFPSR
jgi:hypothetical protein